MKFVDRGSLGFLIMLNLEVNILQALKDHQAKKQLAAQYIYSIVILKGVLEHYKSIQSLYNGL